MKNLFTYLAFVFAIVLLFGFAYSINPEEGDGKKLFIEKKCNTCHSVEVAEIEGKKKDPVDLSTTGDNYNSEFLAKFLVKNEKINDKEHKTTLKGTEEEKKAIAEWLSSLKSEKP
jgi:cytochrome c peroxidase